MAVLVVGPLFPLDNCEECSEPVGDRLRVADGCKFVYSVRENISHDEMKQEFRRFGSVTDKGYAFSTMSSPYESQAAVSQMHGAKAFGQMLKVNVAKQVAGDKEAADMEDVVEGMAVE